MKKYIATLLAGLSLFFAATGAVLADNRYEIAAVDDVNGNATFAGTMTTSSPFSLDYGFSVLDFDLHYLTKDVAYNASNSTVLVEAQGFLFTAKDASSAFELTFYPDGSYYSEYSVPGRNTYADSGYFAFGELAPVPEPASVTLLLAGLGALGCRLRRRQQTVA
ncbi:PEP-CTERM sorting domain-containing protein [Roseateles sp.]|uniref:PEP-CTERM sorting domain-containing protein n=1 Tax=Roseateles sp. TaxID=1971397 RepID=UPI003BAA529B